MEYVISDLHFNSENIIKYCNRPFANADVARDEMIRRWNEKVNEQDTVYVLGDFIMGAPETVPAILNQLNGHIVLVRGNHDTRRKLAIYAQYPEKIEVHDIFYREFNGLWLVMYHFPMTDEGFLDMVVQDNSEVVVLHGHVHDKNPFFNERNHVFNVSADVTDFAPVPLTVIHGMVKRHFIETGVWREVGKEEDKA
jgi:calcineurin-like phosphoesterase family protein